MSLFVPVKWYFLILEREGVMRDLELDLELAELKIADLDNEYSKLYQNSNEPLEHILSNFNFRDKKILSVLASSDQLFSFYALGATDVDTFDCNPLAEYYYYLRKCCLDQRGTLEPYLYSNLELLSMIDGERSSNFLQFWKELLERYPDLMNSPLFYPRTTASYRPFDGKEEKLELPEEISFTCQNIFKPIVSYEKYDVIYLSNVLDQGKDNSLKLRVCRDNLNTLLCSSGIVICTNLGSGRHSLEINIFSDCFLFFEGKEEYNSVTQKINSPYYVYQKK